MQNVEKMEWISKDSASTAINTSHGYTAIKMMNDVVYFCEETTIEILLKIDDAEQRERSFIDDWEKEVGEQLSKLNIRKDSLDT